MYKLHGFFTQNSMKPLYVLEELGVEYEYVYVDLGSGANRTDEFRQMTPVGKVPVLEHEGRYLFESGAICRYVASNEQSALFPADKFERAQVDQWMTFFSLHPGRWLTRIYFEKVIKPMANLGETDEAGCVEAEKFIHQQFKVLDARLKDHDWLANDMFSIAEPFALAYMEQIRPIQFALTDYPNLQAWFDRVDGRDSIGRAREQVEPFMKAFMGS